MSGEGKQNSSIRRTKQNNSLETVHYQKDFKFKASMAVGKDTIIGF